MCIPFHIYFGLDWFFYWEGVIGCSAGNWHFGILSPSSLPCPPLLAPYIICPFPPCQFGSFSQYHLTINPMTASRLRPLGFPPIILFGFFFLCLAVQIQAQYYNSYYNPYSYYNYNNYYRPYNYNNNNYYSSYYNPYYYNNNNNYYNYNRGYYNGYGGYGYGNYYYNPSSYYNRGYSNNYSSGNGLFRMCNPCYDVP